jgi:hypothetical protein
VYYQCGQQIVEKVRERLEVNKPRSHRFHMERIDIKKYRYRLKRSITRSQIGLQL